MQVINHKAISQRVKDIIKLDVDIINTDQPRKLAGYGYRSIYKRDLQEVITIVLISLTALSDTLQKNSHGFP